MILIELNLASSNLGEAKSVTINPIYIVYMVEYDDSTLIMTAVDDSSSDKGGLEVRESINQIKSLIQHSTYENQ